MEESEQDPLEKYLLIVHKSNILQILLDPDTKKHYSININFVELFENNTNLGNTILKRPEEALTELDDWILHIQDILIKEYNNQKEYIAKSNVHARVYGLPPCPELHRTTFPKNEDMDLFLQVTGTVIRVTVTKMLEYQRNYICTKCKHVETIEAILDQKYIILPPRKCTNTEKCAGTKFVTVGDLSSDNCKDYQEIKIQEQSSKVGVGVMPCAMWVILEDDLVDSCKPGDDVTICGLVKRRWGTFAPSKWIEVELVIKANHIQINNGQTFSNLVTPDIQDQFISFWNKHQDCPLKGRDLILKSFCPKIFGMHLVKLAVCMILAGGSRCLQGNQVGIQLRSEPHILLVGDPGTGKSQILRYASKVMPRSVLTTGVGTTSAGLTVAAVMEDGQWQLEGGALVLADGGICCIDEFNSMKAHDRASIHEAMEQQTISVAKASIVCKLSTRCSILAATNPKGGHLDSSQCLSLNLALPSPLLSRFDVVLMLKDSYDKDWDNLIADYILSNKSEIETKIDPTLWNLEILQQYFTVIRKLNPILTEATNTVLSAYYQAQRRATFRNKARTTVRLLESLVRLSQAHAKLMFHTKVQIMDAIFAIIVIESSMHGECAVLNLSNLNVQAPSSSTPMQSYADLVQVILTQLGLHELLRVEYISLSNKYDCTFNEETTLNITDATVEHNNKTIQISESEILRLNDNSIIKTDDKNETAVTTINKVNSVFLKSQQEVIHFDNEKNTISIDVEPTNKNVSFFELSDSTESNIIKGQEDIENVTETVGNFRIENVSKTTKNKKRKIVKMPKSTKEIKIPKKDVNLFNLIPSVNDEFDLDILNYTDSQDNNSTKCLENINFQNSKSKDVKSISEGKDVKSNNEDKLPNNYIVATSSSSASCKNYFQQFKKSYSATAETVKLKATSITESIANVNLNKSIIVVDGLNNDESNGISNIKIQKDNKASQRNLTQSLFETQDEDIDNLNLDF